jgi:hypothetical protein
MFLCSLWPLQQQHLPWRHGQPAASPRAQHWPSDVLQQQMLAAWAHLQPSRRCQAGAQAPTNVRQCQQQRQPATQYQQQQQQQVRRDQAANLWQVCLCACQDPLCLTQEQQATRQLLP